MNPAPNEPSSQRFRLSLWALLPIAFGVLLLFGGVIGGAVVLSRRAPAASVATVAPIVSAPALSAPGAPPPKLALPSAEPEEPLLLPAAAAGAKTGAAEASALLPLVAGQPIWGTAEALVTVDVFGDLECPHTRAALRSVVRLAARFHDRVRLLYSQRPLADRPTALAAAHALAGLAARSPDAAWRALAELSLSSEPADSTHLAAWFSRAGVEQEPERLGASQEARKRVDEDRQLATLLDVQQTPTLFVNGRRFSGETPDAVLEAAIESEVRAVRWLRAQGIAADESYARRVRQNLIGVESGAPSRACVPSDDAPASGPREAPLTIVEFSDFQCTHCRVLDATLTSVLARHPGSARRVWRSFALPQHPRAQRLAAFARAVRDLSGERAFWAVHAALFQIEAGDFGDQRLIAIAAKLHLDGERLLAAADDPERQRALERDHELGESLGLNGAPTLFVNGREIAGAIPEAALEALLKEEIAAARRVVHNASGVRAAESVLCGG